MVLTSSGGHWNTYGLIFDIWYLFIVGKREVRILLNVVLCFIIITLLWQKDLDLIFNQENETVYWDNTPGKQGLFT